MTEATCFSHWIVWPRMLMDIVKFFRGDKYFYRCKRKNEKILIDCGLIKGYFGILKVCRVKDNF